MASSSILAGSASASIASGDPSSFVHMIQTVQLFSLLYFLTIQSTPTLKGFFAGMLKDSQIPNIYSLIANEYDDSTMPDIFTT